MQYFFFCREPAALFLIGVDDLTVYDNFKNTVVTLDEARHNSKGTLNCSRQTGGLCFIASLDAIGNLNIQIIMIVHCQ